MNKIKGNQLKDLSGLEHSTETLSFLASPSARSYNTGYTKAALADLGERSEPYSPKPLGDILIFT